MPMRHHHFLSRLPVSCLLALLLLALTQCAFFDSEELPEAPPSQLEKTVDTRIFPVLENPELYSIPPGSSGRKVTLPTAETATAVLPTGGNISLPLTLGDSENELDWEAVEIGEGEEFTTDSLPLPAFAPALVVAPDNARQLTAHPAANPENPAWNYRFQADTLPSDTVESIIRGNRLFIAAGKSVQALQTDTGRVLWTRELPLPVRARPAVNERAVYLLTSNNELWALDTGHGSLLWHYRGLSSTTERRGGAQPALGKGILVVAFASGEVAAFNPQAGAIGWRQEVAQARRTSAANALADIDASPRIVGNRVYIISSGGLFVCLDAASGVRLWEKEISGVQPPWIAGDYLFLLDSAARVLAFDRHSGEGIWQATLPRDPEDPPVYYGPVVVNGSLLVTNDQGEMLVLRAADGRIIARHDIPDDVRTPPLPAHNRLYLFGKDAALYIASNEE